MQVDSVAPEEKTRSDRATAVERNSPFLCSPTHLFHLPYRWDDSFSIWSLLWSCNIVWLNGFGGWSSALSYSTKAISVTSDVLNCLMKVMWQLWIMYSISLLEWQTFITYVCGFVMCWNIWHYIISLSVASILYLSTAETSYKFHRLFNSFFSTSFKKVIASIDLTITVRKFYKMEAC